MPEIEVEQRSDAWHSLRFGYLTASKADLLARRTEASWTQLARELEHPVEFENQATRHGDRWERPALAEIAWQRQVDIRTCGFITHPTLDYVGCSPDGCIEAVNAGVEIKCPFNPANHEKARAKMPNEHRDQVQFQMMVAGFAGVYFASFDPRAPLAHRLYLHWIPRDWPYIAQLQQACEEFWLFYMGKMTMAELQERGRVSGRHKTAPAAVPTQEFNF